MQECAKTAVGLVMWRPGLCAFGTHHTIFACMEIYLLYNSKCHNLSLSPEAEPEVVQLSAFPPTVAMPIVPLCTPGSCRDLFTRVQWHIIYVPNPLPHSADKYQAVSVTYLVLLYTWACWLVMITMMWQSLIHRSIPCDKSQSTATSRLPSGHHSPSSHAPPPPVSPSSLSAQTPTSPCPSPLTLHVISCI